MWKGFDITFRGFWYAKSKNQCWQAEKMAFSLSNLHIFKMVAKVKKNSDICKRTDI